jgi:type IV secretory pathway VirB3-like protein
VASTLKSDLPFFHVVSVVMFVLMMMFVVMIVFMIVVVAMCMAVLMVVVLIVASRMLKLMTPTILHMMLLDTSRLSHLYTSRGRFSRMTSTR